MSQSREQVESILAAAKKLLVTPPAEKSATVYAPGARYPLESVSLGGEASARDQLRETLARKGVKADISPDGNPIATSERHLRKIARALGFQNKDGYF